MPYYNNQKNSRRIRGRSCPAGVRFEINDIKNDDGGAERKEVSPNVYFSLAKEINVIRQRRSSLPSGVAHEGVNIPNVERGVQHLDNYSLLAGGVHNSFCCKLEKTVQYSHSSIERSHQHKHPSNCDVKKSFPSDTCLPRTLTSDLLPKETLDAYYKHSDSSNTYCEKDPITCTARTFQCKETPITDLNETSRLLATVKEGELENFLGFGDKDKDEKNVNAQRFVERLWGLKVTDLDDNLVTWLKQVSDPGELDKDVERLECHVYGTELLVESLASQVEETKRELEMSKKRQESELSDLLSLNEEMQTIWSEKESEVREMLDRFSAYRDAVEADSKENEEVYAEELNKRDMVIKELKFSKNNLEEELTRKADSLENVIKDLEQLEATRLQEFLEIEELVVDFAGTCTESEREAKTMFETISARLQSGITKFKDSDSSKYRLRNCQVVKRRGDQLESDNDESVGGHHLDKSLASVLNGDSLGTQFENNRQEKQKNELVTIVDTLGVTDEQSSKDVKQLESCLDNISRSENTLTGNTELYEASDYQFQDKNAIFCDEIGNFKSEQSYSDQEALLHHSSKSDTLVEDLAKIVKRIEEEGGENERNDEEEDLMEPFIERKAVVKLFEEQWTRYQLACKEKDDEIQHWRKKHKQDTKDLQDILEDQERTEVKNNEALTKLQFEVDKLRHRNKFLESEVEITKEQGEDEVCVLRENFQKDLSNELRRQSISFLSVEEATRFQLIELETKNDVLRRSNDGLRRQIAEHCTEIKSWVTEILLLSEEEYNEEFHTVSDVLAKLQKIILENERTINGLQSELNVCKDTGEEDSLADDFLSQSWGGHSGNMVDSEKDLCRNCKQKKWRRVLMGSFDLVDTGLEVKQDEIEEFVARIDLSEPKYRKKQSLKDSLELADAQIEFSRRLGSQSSLETLGEDSLEAYKRSGSEFEDFQRGGSSGGNEEDDDSKMPWSGRFTTLEDTGNAGFHVGGVDSRRFGQHSVLVTSEEVDGIGRHGLGLEAKMGGIGSGRIPENEGKVKNEIGDTEKGIGEGGEEEVMDEEEEKGEVVMNGGGGREEEEEEEEEEEQMDGEEEDDTEDLVRVVNLYRSLVVENSNQYQKSKNHSTYKKNMIEVDDELAICSGGVVFSNGNVDEQHGSSKGNAFSSQKIVLGIDYGETSPEKRVKDEMRDDFTGNGSKSNIEQQRNQISFEVFDTEEAKKENGLRELGSKERLLTGEKGSDEVHQPELEISEELCVDSEIGFPAVVHVGKPLTGSCSHCTTITENATTYEKTIEKLLELKSQQAKDRELEMTRELDDRKADVNKYQRQYEELEKVCEEYKKRIDDYSENVRIKNAELRRLKLSSGIMKTEVEWLRQALGITNDYCARDF